MRPPKFWNRGGKWHPLAMALFPLSKIWAGVAARRLRKGRWETLPLPVICVGNINAGGTGKTPSVIALAGFLTARGLSVHVVSRGYGGSEIGPLRVDERSHTVAQTGDEPLLISAFCPTWVAKDRAAGAKAAVEAGAEVILLDDGFQNPALKKDLSIIVVDAEVGFGNGHVMPAGPLREALNSGLARGDVLLSIGSPQAQEKLTANWPQIAGKPRLEAMLKPLQMGMDWQGQRVIAFAGIGRPGKFFATLRAEGAEIIEAHAFTDHATFSDTILQRLLKESRQKNAQLVTTEKDAARLPASFRPEVISLPVRLEIPNEELLEDLMKKAGVNLN